MSFQVYNRGAPVSRDRLVRSQGSRVGIDRSVPVNGTGNRERVVEVPVREVENKIPAWVWIVGAILVVLLIIAIVLWLTKSTPDQLNAPCADDTDCATSLVCTNQRCQVPVNLKSGLGGPCTGNADCASGLACGEDDKCHVACAPPSAVTNIMFESDESDLNITWTPSLGADSYLISVFEVGNPSGVTLFQTTTPNLTLTSPTPGTYSFVVWPRSGDCGLGDPSVVTGVVVPVPP